MNLELNRFPVCDWCNECDVVREVFGRYICFKCNVKERNAGRPIVGTSPVKDFYMDENGNICKH